MNTRRSAGCAVISLILIFTGCATTQQVDMEQFSSDMSPAISADSPEKPEAGIPRVSSRNRESGLEQADHPQMLPIIRSHESVSPGVEGSIRSTAVSEPVFSDASISLPLPELKQSRTEDAEAQDEYSRETSQERPDANADANPEANPAINNDEPGETTRASEQGELPLPNLELNTESIAELPSPSEPEEPTQDPVNRPDSAVTVEESSRDNAAAPGTRKISVGVSPSRTSASQPADSKASGASAPADGGKLKPM
ncbi:hypothetical protein [Salinispira pacifica]|nr:hypothetical protein [Salinispira pacifica]